jgi:hypothetical protein
MQPIVVRTTDATAGTTYSRPVRMDSYANAQSVVQVDVTGTVNFTVETSMDDPNDTVNPVAEASMVWINAVDTNLVAKTADAVGAFVVTPSFIRIKQVSGNGSTKMTIAQFGNAPY